MFKRWRRFSKRFDAERKRIEKDLSSPPKLRMDIVRCYNQLNVQFGEINELRQRIKALEKKVTEYWREP